ncbi:MAG: helix-turn-helix domain-containing protein, partial [Oscillospiraceae bacterium]|nr:helix-turn-helix domain-containing protein [Oscillospiraceae bacterium]
MKLRLKELRRESGATQRQIAEYLGLKQQTYSRYE